MDFFFIKRHSGGHLVLERFARDDFYANINQVAVVKGEMLYKKVIGN